MTRDEAMTVLAKFNEKYQMPHTSSTNNFQLEVFEALGMLKFDEPMTKRSRFDEPITARSRFEKVLLSRGCSINVIMPIYDRIHGHD